MAVQLYSIHKYIKGKDGLAKALQEVAKIGYKGVEFAGYYGASADEIKKMLADAGLVACGTHVGRAEFGPDKIKATCEFNLAYGNSFICCPGGGNFPGKGENLDDFMKMLVDYYNTAAETAATYGCKIGLHNHKGEFERKLSNGQTYWDYFFSQTADNVCMEQDVGWTTAAGRDPCIQYAKFPHRSPTLHAKENGMGSKKFDAILGQPGDGAVGVAWDRLFPVTDADGVKWYVVECERHFDSLMPITESFKFLQSKGRC
ncbi:MAG: sugar phosphate isomerase/epimerase [Kiritimatiellae bacterium]|nr:sugar phosphate isomerase/epimerase [Kiritimatiellia bacterium]